MLVQHRRLKTRPVDDEPHRAAHWSGLGSAGATRLAKIEGKGAGVS